MPMLDGSWSPQIRKIGDLERSDHYYLTEDHDCYFFGEYTAHQGYSHSSTNQIISNLKKSPTVRGTSQWPYKVKAIRRVAACIGNAINPEAIGRITLVPIPPSKMKNHSEYDDRMVAVARAVSNGIDVRELIVSTADREAAHKNDQQRLKPHQLMGMLQIDEAVCPPVPREIFLIDDVVTTGCSFVACRTLLQNRFPNIAVSGIFAARRAIGNDATHGFDEVDF